MKSLTRPTRTSRRTPRTPSVPQRKKDAEIARLKARIAELESRPAPVAAPLQASGPDAETTEAIERLCRQCEQAIYANMSRGAVL